MKYIITVSGNALIVNSVTILGNVVISVEANTYITISQDGIELARMLWNDILSIDDSEPASLEEAYSLLQATAGTLVPNNRLADLKDTNIGAPSNNQVLTYDSGSKKWVNKNPTSTGGGGGGSAFLKKQVFSPIITITYVTPAVTPFTVGATVTGDVTLATGLITDVNEVDGVLTITNVTGNFDGTDTLYSDDSGGQASCDGQRETIVTDVQILDDTGVLYYEPITGSNKPVPKATITLPLNPTDGQQVLVHFGNILFPSGVEITTPSVACNNTHMLIPNALPTIKAQVGSPMRAIFREIPEDLQTGMTGLWYIG